jgi:hypothetical protein
MVSEWRGEDLLIFMIDVGKTGVIPAEIRRYFQFASTKRAL